MRQQILPPYYQQMHRVPMPGIPTYPIPSYQASMIPQYTTSTDKSMVRGYPMQPMYMYGKMVPPQMYTQPRINNGIDTIEHPQSVDIPIQHMPHINTIYPEQDDITTDVLPVLRNPIDLRQQIPNTFGYPANTAPIAGSTSTTALTTASASTLASAPISTSDIDLKKLAQPQPQQTQPVDDTSTKTTTSTMIGPGDYVMITTKSKIRYVGKLAS